MKTTIGEVIDKVKELEKTTSMLCNYIIDNGCSDRLDVVVEHLEDYKDLIRSIKVDI